MSLEIDTSVELWLSGIASIAAVAISSYNIYLHLKSWQRPRMQRSVIRILMIVPLYSIVGFISLCEPNAALYFDTIRDLYEAYVIYLFLDLMIAFAGGDSMCASDLRHRGQMNHLWPCCCLTPLQLGQEFLRYCKMGTLQFVIIKPIMACLTFLFLGLDLYYSLWYQWFLSIVYNTAYTIALVALAYFYYAVRNLIMHFNPFKKFLAVKIVVFATYWQSVAVLSLPYNMEKLARLDDFILCLEMVVFALLHLYAFSPREFANLNDSLDEATALDGEFPTSTTSMHKKIISVMNMKELADDVTDAFGDNRSMPMEEYRGVALLSLDDAPSDELDDNDMP